MKPNFSCEDVLNAFAVEPTHDRATLERYLRQYPEYAVELANLSHDLSHVNVKGGDLSEKDRAVIEEAWKQYSTSAPVPVRIFISLSVPQLRDLANHLGVPRQIITAFREHKVVVSSIPQRFLGRLASALNTTAEAIRGELTMPLEVGCVRSHKSDEKPETVAPATFEQLLIDAQVPEKRRAELMADDD